MTSHFPLICERFLLRKIRYHITLQERHSLCPSWTADLVKVEYSVDRSNHTSSSSTKYLLQLLRDVIVYISVDCMYNVGLSSILSMFVVHAGLSSILPTSVCISLSLSLSLSLPPPLSLYFSLSPSSSLAPFSLFLHQIPTPLSK